MTVCALCASHDQTTQMLTRYPGAAPICPKCDRRGREKNCPNCGRDVQLMGRKR